MRDQVSVSDLKAHLSRHLREVKRGRAITVLQHGHPVARLVPYAGGVTVRAADLDIRKVKLPHTGVGTTNVVGELLAERRRK